MGRTDRLPRCGVVMRQAKEPCARMAGHRGNHSTRYALDNAYRAAIGRDPDPYVYRNGEWVTR